MVRIAIRLLPGTVSAWHYMLGLLFLLKDRGFIEHGVSLFA